MTGENIGSGNARTTFDVLSQLLTESRVPLNSLTTHFDPKDSINNWLTQYEFNCNRFSLSDGQKMLHIIHYLPSQIANWVSRSPRTSTWPLMKEALLDTYGIPAKKYKQVVRSRLEALRQRSTPSRQFSVLFEDVTLDYPAGHYPDEDTLRAIYLKVMSPNLRALILPNITSLGDGLPIVLVSDQVLYRVGRGFDSLEKINLFCKKGAQ